MADNEGNEPSENVTLVSGGVTESDLTILAADIQKMVVAPSDWTIAVLVDLLKKNKIDLQPNYQRRVAWDEKKMSRFIESLFLRLPVPQIVLAEMKPGRFAVIDGKQRMNSIARFCLDRDQPLRLENCEYRKELNGHTYEDLANNPKLEEAMDAFQSHTVRTIVIKNWSSDELLYLLFLRLNQNSVTLSPQELRRALFPGAFMNWLDDKTAASEGMKTIFTKVPDFRMRDMEVATRHLAFRMKTETYAGNMKQFLDSATEDFSQNWKTRESELEDEWLNYESAIALTREIFGANAFQSYVSGKYQTTKNRAVMDIMTYYFAVPEVRAAAAGKHPAIKSAFEQLCTSNNAFLLALQTSTKTLKATSERFHDWADELTKILGNVVTELPLARNPKE